MDDKIACHTVTDDSIEQYESEGWKHLKYVLLPDVISNCNNVKCNDRSHREQFNPYFGQEYDVKFNARKSICMIFRRSKERYLIVIPKIKLAGELLEWCKVSNILEHSSHQIYLSIYKSDTNKEISPAEQTLYLSLYMENGVCL